MKELHPFIFWHSDPVRPDETLVLAGEDFAENAFVELARLAALRELDRGNGPRHVKPRTKNRDFQISEAATQEVSTGT